MALEQPFLYSYLAKLLCKTNIAARYPDPTGNMSLATARTDVALGIAGSCLTIVDKGTGEWTIKIKFGDGSNVQFDSADITDGDTWEVEFVDLLFTNAVQAFTGPSFYYAWRI